MDLLYEVLECPRLKLRKPNWMRMPSAMVIYGMILLSYFLVTGGIIYDIIVEPPSMGSQPDERGNSRPVAFMAYRVNGQYILEGLASSFMFTLGAVGFVLLDIANRSKMPRLNRIMFFSVAFIFILIGFFCCRLFIRIKLPGYLME